MFYPLSLLLFTVTAIQAFSPHLLYTASKYLQPYRVEYVRPESVRTYYVHSNPVNSRRLGGWMYSGLQPLVYGRSKPKYVQPRRDSKVNYHVVSQKKAVLPLAPVVQQKKVMYERPVLVKPKLVQRYIPKVVKKIEPALQEEVVVQQYKPVITQQKYKSTFVKPKSKLVHPKAWLEPAQKEVPLDQEKAVIPQVQEKAVIPQVQEKTVIPQVQEKAVIPQVQEKTVIPQLIEKVVIPQQKEIFVQEEFLPEVKVEQDKVVQVKEVQPEVQVEEKVEQVDLVPVQEYIQEKETQENKAKGYVQEKDVEEFVEEKTRDIESYEPVKFNQERYVEVVEEPERIVPKVDQVSHSDESEVYQEPANLEFAGGRLVKSEGETVGLVDQGRRFSKRVRVVRRRLLEPKPFTRISSTGPKW